MKIKTITCHNVYNFGASLQAYALMTYLTSQGHQVEIIDYMPDYIRKNLSLWASVQNGIVIYLQNVLFIVMSFP